MHTLLVFAFFFVILLCAPKSYDDFAFSHIARGSLSQVLDFFLRYGNGRLLGNPTGGCSSGPLSWSPLPCCWL